MSGNDASGPNISLIALIVIGIIFMVGFYYADRSSSPETVAVNKTTAPGNSNAEHKADSSRLNEIEERHRRVMAEDDRPGFSGSLQEYLNHAELVESARELSAKGFSGSGDEYLQKGAVSRSVKEVDGVTATGQSLEDYLAGGSAKKASSSGSSKSDKSSGSSSYASSNSGSRSVKEVDGVTATGQSMDDYLANAKPGSGSSAGSSAKSKQSGSSRNESKEPFAGTMDAYLNKFGD